MENYNSIHHFLSRESEKPIWYGITENLSKLLVSNYDLNKDDNKNIDLAIKNLQSRKIRNLDVDLTDSAFLKARSELFKEKRTLDELNEINHIEEVENIPDGKINNQFRKKYKKEISKQLAISEEELSSFIWLSVLNSSIWSEVIFEVGLGNLDDQNLVQLSKHFNDKSYSLLFYHRDVLKIRKYSISNDLKVRLADDLIRGNSIINRIFKSLPNNTDRFSSTKRKREKQVIFSQKAKEIVNNLNLSNFYKLILELDFEIFFLPYPQIEQTSYHVKRSTGVGIVKGQYYSSGGVIAKNKNNNFGITFCYHDFIESSSKGVGDSIFVDGKQATIQSIHKPSDSCFATFDDQNLNLNQYDINNGPLRNVGPGINSPVKFTGITSKNSSTIIQAIDPSIPFIKPSSSIINMQKVYTPPSSQPGDSGAALIDDNKNVIGFAAYRTGYKSPIPFSVWIWADDIFYHHNLKIK